MTIFQTSFPLFRMKNFLLSTMTIVQKSSWLRMKFVPCMVKFKPCKKTLLPSFLPYIQECFTVLLQYMKFLFCFLPIGSKYCGIIQVNVPLSGSGFGGLIAFSKNSRVGSKYCGIIQANIPMSRFDFGGLIAFSKNSRVGSKYCGDNPSKLTNVM